MTDTTIEVMGKPVPQGSTTAFPVKRKNGTYGAVVTHNHGATLMEWRAAIAQAYVDADGALLEEEPVEIEVEFRFVKPKSAKKRTHVTVKPDLDKLLRATLDALTSYAYKDDSQVVSIKARKVYAEHEGATITVRRYV